MTSIINSILNYLFIFCNNPNVCDENENEKRLLNNNNINNNNNIDKNENNVKYIDYSKQLIHTKYSPDGCVFCCTKCGYSFYTLEFFYSEYDYMPYYKCKNCKIILKVRDYIHIRKLKYKCFLFQ